MPKPEPNWAQRAQAAESQVEELKARLEQQYDIAVQLQSKLDRLREQVEAGDSLANSMMETWKQRAINAESALPTWTSRATKAEHRVRYLEAHINALREFVADKEAILPQIQSRLGQIR